jgi:hypothetical protein
MMANLCGFHFRIASSSNPVFGVLHPHLPRPVKLQEIRAGKAIS